MRSSRHLIGVCWAIALAAFWLASPALGDSVVGTNSVLTPAGGNVYIPLTPGASGVLGVAGVGLSSDTANLTGVGDTSAGFVSFVLAFDISGHLGPGEFIDPIQADLTLTFGDMDFKPASIGPATLQETMSLTFLRDATDAPGAVDLLVDNTNYGSYRPDGFGETNNTTASYLVNLMLDLGVSGPDFADINTDKEFGLLVTLASNLTMNQAGSTSITNTTENSGNSFGFVAIPEPATVALLGLGGVVALLRRRRN